MHPFLYSKSKKNRAIVLLIFFLLIIFSPTFILAENQCNNPDYSTVLSSSNTNYTSTDSVYWIGNNYNYHTYYIDLQEPGTITINISGGHAGFTYADNYCPDYYDTYYTTKTFHTASDFNLYVDAMQHQHNTNYTLTINFIPDNPAPGSGNDDICYNDLELSGFCMGLGFCSGGLNCQKTYPLQINSSLQNVKIYYDETGMGGSFGSSCGTDPSGTCQTTYNVDFGLFGFFSQATEFDLGNVDQNTNDPDIWTQNIMGMSCFSTDRLYVTYEKDGAIHKEKLKKCGQTQEENKFREFAIRNPENTRNIRGNVKFIGNTVLKYDGNNYNHLSNAHLNLQYIDLDNNPNTYNSSKALLNIPTGSTIVWAGLYTQGYLKGIISIDEIYQVLNEPIDLTIPSLGTISVTHDVIDYALNKKLSYGTYIKYGYSYDTYSEIKQLEGKTASEVNGWITAANIKCYEGTDNSGLGNYGAWTLVVVYKNPNEKLKNISVFDGYKRVSYVANSDIVNIPVSGFLTPLHGDVNSTLSLFVGEGDKYISGDKLYVNNTAINTTNAFDSSITGVTRNPSIVNNQGIDIQNHNISSIIHNGDTEATIKLTSTQDTYFPSVVAFITDLYEPRVCYYIDRIKDNNDNIIFKNGHFINGAQIDPEKEYNFNLWVSNMKKNQHDNIENARNVQVYVNAPDFNYTSNSTQIKNIGNSAYNNITDQAGDDIGEYNNLTKKFTWRLGVGANATEGGDINVANSFDDNSSKAFIKLKGRFSHIQEDQTSLDISQFYTFKASFQTNSITVTSENAIPIEACVNMDTNTSVYKAPPGNFNVVHSGFTGTIDPLNQEDPKNALYTQIANKSFTVKILALDSNKITLKPYTGDINVTIIPTPNYSGNTNTDNILCKNAILNSSFPVTTVYFSNTPSISQNFIYPSANKNLSFGIIYDNGGSLSYICSRDKFAVRPKKFKMDINGTMPHKAGVKYRITFKALDNNNALTSNYNESISVSFKVDINDTKVGCKIGNFTPDLKTSWSFNNGKHYIDSNYSEVGIVNIKIQEINGSEFAIVDHNDTNDSQRLIVSYDKNISFTPDHFNISSSFKNKGQNFTYISNDLNISAILDINITAKTINNTITQNYNSACYAKNSDINISFSNINISPTNALTKLLYFETNTSTEGNSSINNIISLNNLPNTIFSTDTNGTGSIQLKINFDRNKSKAVNPFDLNVTDINVTDANDTKGMKTLTSFIGNSVRFFYGRVHAPDYSAENNTTISDAKIYYEVYCKDCGKSQYPSLGKESVDGVYWYINTAQDNSKDGNISGFPNFLNTTPSGLLTITQNSISNGIENYTITYTGSSYPYKEKIDINTSSWLIYNPYNQNTAVDSFYVDYSGVGGWAGIGKTGHTIDLNISTRRSKRIEW